jgi:hypothetical protein
MYSIDSKYRLVGTSPLSTTGVYFFDGSWLNMKAYSMIAIVLVVSSGLACAQDLAAGGVQFKKCAPCHDVGETAKNKIGSVLNGIEGRKSGTVPGFKYSEANNSPYRSGPEEIRSLAGAPLQ